MKKPAIHSILLPAWSRKQDHLCAPKPRHLIPLDEWSSQRGIVSGLTAWLADPSHGPCQDALRMSAEAITFDMLRSLTLRMADVLLHHQTEKPEHDAPNRNVADQHRILLVLPQGPAFMASALASLSVGSMVALSQDDLTTEQISERHREFKPDLMIITASTWARLLTANPEVSRQTVLIADDRGDLAALEDLVFSSQKAPELPQIRANAPGLVIFTSGSTGKPRGVVHPADALTLNKAGQGVGADLVFGLSPTDKLTYLGRWDSVSFLDILSSLRACTTVCVPDHETLTSPDEMGKWLTNEGVTCLTAPCTVFGLLLQSSAIAHDRQPALRLTMPWGERISNDLSHQLYQKFPDASHLANYGASEAIWISVGRLSRPNNDINVSMACPGGSLIHGVEMTLVGETGEEVKQGETGNPRVSGPGVMLGYLDDLMAGHDTLIPSPVCLQDFARLTADGSIQLLGRSDSIIKIAGRRISLLEIEAAAEMAGGVKEAVAFVDAEAVPHQVLVAVTRAGPRDDGIASAVENSIAERCFASARPARVLVMENFPRLPNGKRDRKAVEKQSLNDTRREVAPTKIATATSGSVASPLLAEIASWAALRLGIREREFDLDARIPPLDSLMVMELQLIAEEVCGAILPGSVFEQHRGLKWADLAAELEYAAKQVAE